MALWLNPWPAIHEIWVQFPALPFTSCVTLGKLGNLCASVHGHTNNIAFVFRDA